MNEVVTQDLSEFGYREIREAIELLNAYLDRPSVVEGEGLVLGFNKNSGFVFLSDGEYNSYMVNPTSNKLEKFFSCSNCGAEGFLDELENFDAENNLCKDCKEKGD